MEYAATVPGRLSFKKWLSLTGRMYCTHLLRIQDVSLLTNQEYAKSVRARIGERTQDDPEYYGAKFFMPPDSGTAHVSVLSADGDAVSVTSTLDI